MVSYLGLTVKNVSLKMQVSDCPSGPSVPGQRLQREKNRKRGWVLLYNKNPDFFFMLYCVSLSFLPERDTAGGVSAVYPARAQLTRSFPVSLGVALSPSSTKN